MKLLFASLLATLLIWPACTTTYYLVRHAERLNDNNDSPLSPVGHARANILRDTLANKGIDQIFASTIQRTQQTGQPLATALGMALTVYRPDTTAGLVARLKNIRNKSVLVVGHSNTVPDLVKGLCGEIVTIPDNDFDNLYIVTIRRAWGRTTTNLVQTTYGPASP